MTTTVCVTPLGLEGAPSLTDDGALDPYEGLKRLLPKLAKPSWVRLIKSAQARPKAQQPSPQAERCIRRNAKKASRLRRALNGEHTRAA